MQPISRKEILFIVNQKAGGKTIFNILSALRKQDLSFSITEDLEALHQMMQKQMDRYTVFVAVGGDGTVNALANYLIGRPDKILAVLPTGSGNGFARELGFKKDLNDLIQKIVTGHSIQVDSLSINEKKFINVAGIGFDAFVASAFQNTKRGFLHYILTAFTAYSKHKSSNYIIQTDSIQQEESYFMVSIANTRQFGNHAYISPSSVPDDGQYEIVGIKYVSGWKTIPMIYKLFKGQLNHDDNVHVLTIKGKAVIRTDYDLFHLDGEPMNATGEYHIDILPKSLNVIDTGRIPTKN
jgi:diacylglycerol kinase (ATP)